MFEVAQCKIPFPLFFSSFQAAGRKVKTGMAVFKSNSWKLEAQLATMKQDHFLPKKDHRYLVVEKWCMKGVKVFALREGFELFSKEDYWSPASVRIFVNKELGNIGRANFNGVVVPIFRCLSAAQCDMDYGKEKAPAEHFPKQHSEFHCGCFYVTVKSKGGFGVGFYYEPYGIDILPLASLPSVVESLAKEFRLNIVHIIRGEQKAEHHNCLDHTLNFVYEIMCGHTPMPRNCFQHLGFRKK